ncbi:MAG: ABC transporter substrate-binding protein [Trebonia sp.]
MLTAAACSSNGSSNATLDSSTNITLAVVPSVNNTAAYIAQYEGFFAQQGLNVKIQSFASSAVVIADQLKGSVDICAGAYLPFISREAKGDKFTVLAEGSVMGQNTRVLMVGPHSHITSLRQLEGKTIGQEATNSIGTLLVNALLSENGVPLSSVKYVTSPTGFKTLAKDLTAGKYQAAFFGEPFATQAEEKYGDQVLADLDQGSVQGLPITGFTATSKWVATHRSAAAAFDRAIGEAQQVAATDVPTLRAAIDKSDNLPPVVGQVIALPGFPIGLVNQTRLQRAADSMLQFGLLDPKHAAIVRNDSLIKSMIDPSLQAEIAADQSGTGGGK